MSMKKPDFKRERINRWGKFFPGQPRFKTVHKLYAVDGTFRGREVKNRVTGETRRVILFDQGQADAFLPIEEA